MPYTVEDFMREEDEKFLAQLTPEERLKGLPPEELLKGLSVQERLKGVKRKDIVAY